MRLVPVVLAVAALVPASVTAARNPPDPKAPTQRHRAADTRSARAIALKRADLEAIAPGWRGEPPQKPSPPCSVEPDESMLVQTAQIDPTYVWSDGATSIGSEIDVFRTAAEAKRDWKLSTLRVIRACLLESARAGVGKGVQVRVRSARALPPPAGGDRSFHFRLVFALVEKTRTVPVVTELVGIGSGRTTVVLHAFSPGGPLPASAVNRLTALLAKRLAAAALGI